MKGFKNINIGRTAKVDFFTGAMILISTNPKEDNDRMEEAGFSIDRENEIYIKEGYGAFKLNVDKNIKSIDDLKTFIDRFSKMLKYPEEVRLMEEEGYEFVLGPAAPVDAYVDMESVIGLYCVNYKEILEKDKDKEKDKEEDDER